MSYVESEAVLEFLFLFSQTKQSSCVHVALGNNTTYKYARINRLEYLDVVFQNLSQGFSNMLIKFKKTSQTIAADFLLNNLLLIFYQRNVSCIYIRYIYMTIYFYLESKIPTQRYRSDHLLGSDDDILMKL